MYPLLASLRRRRLALTTVSCCSFIVLLLLRSYSELSYVGVHPAAPTKVPPVSRQFVDASTTFTVAVKQQNPEQCSKSGSWRLVAGIGDNGTASLQWSPLLRGYDVPPAESASSEVEGVSSADPCGFHHYTQHEALTCLQGKYVLFYGNSNTRTLFTALEALLKNSSMMSRLAAKQKCDNSKYNHSCWTRVEGIPRELSAHRHRSSRIEEGGADRAPAEGPTPYAPIHLFYWGYVHEIYHPSMEAKMESQKAIADVVIGNSGLNVMQKLPDGVWEKAQRKALPLLNRFARSFTKEGSVFYWHTTTPLCENQPHFRRYKYHPKFWSGRSLATMNRAVMRHNEIIRHGLELSARVRLLDGAETVKGLVGEQRAVGLLCPHFEDPLHHRFLDREIVQLFLNDHCSPHGAAP